MGSGGRDSIMREGTPLVLLHAFPMDGRMWAPQAAEDFGLPLWVPDLPGFGSSPVPHGPWSLEDQARWLADHLDARGCDRAILCGLSMGGYIALAFAALYPNRIAGLVLADTRATPDADTVKKARGETAGRVLREGMAFLADDMAAKLFGTASKTGNPGLVAQVRDMMMDQDPQGVALALLAMRDRPSREGSLARLRVPVLIVVGSEDGITAPWEARDMAGIARNAQVVQVLGAGHMSNLEAPTAFNGALHRYIAEISRASPRAF